MALLSPLAGSERAWGQPCHTPDVRERFERQLPFRASIAALAATYEHEGYYGDYQGLYGSFAYRAPWWGAEVVLPAYRLDRRGGDEYGLGDLVVSVRGTLYRAWEGDLALGVELPLMLPTGDEERELGMGHVMPMPNVYFALTRLPFVLRAQAGYGRAIGMSANGHAGHSGGAHHAHGATEMRSPLVNPMNRSEFEHALMLGLGLRRDLGVHVRWFGAVPIGEPMGVLRQALVAGATAMLGPIDLTLEVQRALTGGAFQWRTVLQLGATF